MINNIDSHIPDFLIASRYRAYRHLLLQLVIIVMTIGIFTDPSGSFTFTLNRLYAWIGYNLVINVSTYFNLFVLAPRFLMKGKLLNYILSVLGLIFFAIVITFLLQKRYYDLAMIFNNTIFSMLLNMFSSTITVGLIIFGGSTLLLFRYWIRNNQRIDELSSSTLQSELQYLKKQINPHFLFNMLNNANVLIKKNPDEASRVLFKLEDLLRYQINDSAKEKVLLTSEIHFLNDFLNLEKIRRDKFEYTLLEEGDIERVELSSLLFIPFVENAVKHNLDSENKSYVYLSFKVRNGQLEFRCENSKPAIVMERNEVGGIGLKNIKRRLELLFPDNHTLDIEENEKNYTVILHLTL